MRRQRVDPRVQRQQADVPRGYSPDPVSLPVSAAIQPNGPGIHAHIEPRQRRSRQNPYSQFPRGLLPRIAICK